MPSAKLCCRSASRLSSSPCTETSSPAVGSSAIRNDGSATSARAMATRRACPPLTWCGILVELRFGQAEPRHQLEHLRPALALSMPWMTIGSASSRRMVKRGDSDDSGSWKIICTRRAQPQPVGAGQRRQVAASKPHARRSSGGQADQRLGERGLAAAAFADQAERLADAERQADAGHRLHAAGEGDAQILDLDVSGWLALMRTSQQRGAMAGSPTARSGGSSTHSSKRDGQRAAKMQPCGTSTRSGSPPGSSTSGSPGSSSGSISQASSARV